jgi:dihydrofolate synthase/folylpolyglutamate synthase
VIEHVCHERRAPLRQLDVDFHYHYEPGRVGNGESRPPRVAVTTGGRRWPALELNLHGEHQAANAAVVIATIEVLRSQGWHLPDAAVSAGLAQVTWPARMEVVGCRPRVVLDCAHNVASARAVIDTLMTSFPPARRLLIFAGSGDKDIPGIFDVLAPHFAAAWFTRYSLNPRAVPPERLVELWQAAGGTGAAVAATPAQALQAARAASEADDLICVTGSVFLAGELRPLLLEATP